jgi:peptide/nickel transport system permease protein
MNKLAVMIAKRLGLGLLTLFIISVFVSLGVEFLPGDLAMAKLGQSATPETVAAMRLQLGLDLPLHERYILWMSGMLQGDMGTSLANEREISELVGVRLGNTLFLAGLAAMLSVPLAVMCQR